MQNSVPNKKYFVMAMIIIASLFAPVFFCKTDKIIFTTDIYEIALNDTIFNIFSQKFNGIVVVATKLKNKDTTLLIDGVNDSLHLHLYSYSDAGIKSWNAPNISVLSKKAKADSFYLIRNNQIIGFRLIDQSHLIK
jgi:hypothetical protein